MISIQKIENGSQQLSKYQPKIHIDQTPKTSINGPRVEPLSSLREWERERKGGRSPTLCIFSGKQYVGAKKATFTHS